MNTQEHTAEKDAATVEQINALLGINLWAVRSFRADVRIDFDEYGNVLAASLLNPGPTVIPPAEPRPRCPVCNRGLRLWATVVDAVRAECDGCGWEWRG